MPWVLAFYRSSIGKKVLMAATGIALFGFVVGHLAGNLQIYWGAERLNHYAESLRAVPALVWGARLGLLAAVTLHIVVSVQLARMSSLGRPISYARRDDVQASYAARTMRWSGPLVGLFVVYHLLHFTLGTVHPDFNAADVYGNVILGFRVWPVSLFYIVAMLALGFHLYHGLWSMFQSLGLNHPQYNALRRGFAVALSAFIVVGNISIPVAVLAGWIS